MIGRRGFLGGLVAAAFTPAAAAAAQFTLAAPVMTDEIAASMRRKTIMALGLNPDMIDNGLSEFSTSRIAMEESCRRHDHYLIGKKKYSAYIDSDGHLRSGLSDTEIAWMTNPDINKDGSRKTALIVEINKLGEVLNVTRAP